MHDWLAGIFYTIWLAGWPRTPGSPEMADGMALDGGWPPPPAAAPDPELRTIVGDGYQAATAAVPGAGAPFFAVLGLVPGRLALKMGGRTVDLVIRLVKRGRHDAAAGESLKALGGKPA